jgi:hypothetical protein
MKLAGWLEILSSYILNIPITIHGQCPNHHLHCSTSGQISSLFYLSDKISELELCRIAGIFCSSSLTPQLDPKSFTCQLTVHTVLLAGAGAASEQTADHG